MGTARGTVGASVNFQSQVLKTYLNPFQVLGLLEKCTKIIISKYIHISNQYTVYLKLTQLCMSIISQ